MRQKVLILIILFCNIISIKSFSQWSRVNSVPAIDIVAFAGVNHKLFAASDSNLVYKSVDGGTTWNPTAIGNNSIRIITLTVIDDTIYAGTDHNGIIRSADFGTSWTIMGNALLPITGIIKAGNDLFASSLGDGVYKYNRLINSWAPFNNLLPSYSINVNSIIDAGGSPFIAAGANVRHICWIRFLIHGRKDFIMASFARAAIQQLKKDANDIFAVNWNHIFKSIDNGTTWVDDDFDATNGYSRIFHTGSQNDFISNEYHTRWNMDTTANKKFSSRIFLANDEEFLPGGYGYDIIEFEKKLFLGKADGVYVKNASTSLNLML
jgi:hypothetical protein